MKLIEDLGMQEYGLKGSSRRFGLYECPVCLKHITCSMSDVLLGKTTKCRLCANRLSGEARMLKAKEAFIDACREVHGDLYDYSNTDYKGKEVKVSIGCKTHGVFWQRAGSHKRGDGCPHCAKDANSLSKRQAVSMGVPITLYYVYIPEHKLWKIGCTSKCVRDRFKLDKIIVEVIMEHTFTNSVEAYNVEAYILKSTIHNKYFGEPIMKGGNSELRVREVTNIEELLKQGILEYSASNNL